MTRLTRWLAVGSLALLSTGLIAQQTGQPARRPTTQPSSSGAATRPAGQSAEEIMREMSRQAAPNPMVDPAQRPPEMPTPKDPRPGPDQSDKDRRAPNTRVSLDPAVIGAAPGTPQPKLRREGEFVINRRGRISRASSGNQVLFTFEADSENAAEMPMVLLPSQMLQNMEDLVQERGDQIVFVLTGEVTTYRGANYLMPTMWKLAIDRGNIQK